MRSGNCLFALCSGGMHEVMGSRLLEAVTRQRHGTEQLDAGPLEGFVQSTQTPVRVPFISEYEH